MERKKNFSNFIRIISIVVIFSTFFILNLYSQNFCYLRLNKYWGSVNSIGTNTGTSFSASNLYLFADQDAVGCRLNGEESCFGGYVTLACTNWKNPVTGEIIEKAIFPPVNELQPNGLEVIEDLANYIRYEPPVDSIYYQDTELQLPQPDFGMVVDVNPEKCIGTSDQTVMVKNKYVNGVILTKRVLSWGNNKHDNYVIVDITLDNPADNDTLHNFYVFFQEGWYYFIMADGHNPGIASVDDWFNGDPRMWFHYYGALKDDSLRIFYQYPSDDPEKNGDNMGQPLTEQNGRLFSKNFYFAATLHASKEPYVPNKSVQFPAIDPNDKDDMNQPTVTTFANIQQGINLGLFSQSTPVDYPRYYDFISGQVTAGEDMQGNNVRPGHHRKNLDELGKSAPGGDFGCGPLVNSFESMVYCYGPYEFAPGTRIRIVKASGFAGISREQAVEVGRKWMNGTLDDPLYSDLPPWLLDGYNPETGFLPENFVFPEDATEIDKIKDRWLSLGIKLVHKTVSLAKRNFLSGYNAEMTPPPPPKSVVRPTNEGIKISWEPSPAENWPGFIGYKLERKVSTYDTVFYKVVYTGKDNEYIDVHVRPSPKYFYRIYAGVETSDGDTIWSSPFWRYNVLGTSANQPPSTGGLDEIVMVPNPFNYNDKMLAKYLFEKPKNLTLTFFNLPKDVTISIYTEYGDLVRKVKTTGTGDYKMKLVNEDGQPIASGVYIVVFTNSNGDMAYKKLIVVR
ncbi:MAG: hypothetical protein H0Z29_00060 [Candidatus Marinimicrobia bacterium]|nr:hypothetical protein [Candidatus Neomarinimicrobiota bacterium]